MCDVIIEFIKKWWFLLLDLLAEWLDGLDNNRLSIVANLMAIGLMLIGFIDWVIKDKLRPRKRHLFQRVAGTTKPPKYLTYLENPTERGQELGELIEDIYKGGKSMSKAVLKTKNFFRIIWGNKAQIADSCYVFGVGVISNIIIYSDLGTHLLPNKIDTLWFRVIITAVSVIMTIISWVDTMTSRKFNSLDEINAAQLKKEQNKQDKLMTEAQKAKYGKLLEGYQNQHAEIKSQIQEVDNAIELIRSAIELQTTTEAAEANKLYQLNNQKSKLVADLTKVEQDINIVNNAINKK